MADKEYIEREALIENFKSCGASKELTEAIIYRINSRPTADVVEVVRCKNCKFKHDPTRCALWYGEVNGTAYLIERGDEFYCSYGERKE